MCIRDSLDGYESTLDSPAFDLFNIDGQFLMNTVTQENFYLKNGIIANGSRKAKRIHVDTFLEMDILTPSIEEQVKIGGCRHVRSQSVIAPFLGKGISANLS